MSATTITNSADCETQVGIVHFGVGRFHRAHQAVYMDELIRSGDKRWGICGVCMMPWDKPMYDAMTTQQGQFTVIEMDHISTSMRKINSIVDVIFGYEHPETVFQTLARDSVKVVTFTVTEAGYFYQPSTKALDFSHQEVARDLELYQEVLAQYWPAGTAESRSTVLNPNPHTLYGYLSLGLLHRYVNNLQPFTVQSCDNIQGNGDMTKSLLLEFCRNVDTSALQLSAQFTGFLEWLDSTVAFPNSMVDRITPAASAGERQLVQEADNNGVQDMVPVSCESYRQWVIEDNFCNTKPPYENLENTSLVSDIKPYEKIKIRCLNGGHSALGYAGHLAGFKTIDETAVDATFQAYLRMYFQEVSATLDEVSGINLSQYQDKLLERFSNPNIKDDVLRICKDGSSKIPGFILPTIVEVLDQNTSSKCLSFLIASWIAFIKHEQAHGADLDDIESAVLFDLVRQVSENNDDVRLFLSARRWFGDLSDNSTFVAQVQAAYCSISADGVVAAMAKLSSS